MFYKLRALQKALGSHYQLYKIKKHLWLNSAQLKNLQERKLEALLKYTYNKVSYYKRLFDQAGIKPEDIKTIDNLQQIPITSRKSLQALPIKERVAEGINLAQCRNLRTSGSTGRTLDIFIGGQDKARRLSYLRMYFENGRRFSDKVLVITTPHNFLKKQWFHPWLYSLKMLRERYISLYEKTDYFLKELMNYKPNIILSYPSIIKELASEIKKREIKGINPRMIFLTGEMLSNKDKTFIESVFKAEIFDYYSCSECGIIAWECREHKGYHIDIDNVIVELIKNGKPVSVEEEGEVIITALNSYTMPFIRYNLGDIGIPSDERCPCGREFPLMKIFKGRVADKVILPDGKNISYYSLTNKLDNITEISMYQVIQEKIDKIRINIVRDEKFSSNTVPQVEKRCKEVLGNDIDLEVKIVENIPRSKAGKYKIIISSNV